MFKSSLIFLFIPWLAFAAAPPNPIYVDPNNATGLASDANTGADVTHPILTIPGMTDKTDTTPSPGPWCNGTITTGGLNVPDGTTFIIRGGATINSNICGRLHFNASSVGGALPGYPCYYTKTPIGGTGITLQTATNWGTGPVSFDFTNCSIRDLANIPGSILCCDMTVSLDGVAGFTTRKYANMQGGSNSFTSDGFIVSNSVNVPYFAFAHSVAQGGSLYYPGPHFRANFFYNNGTGQNTPTNMESRYTYVLTGDSGQFFTWGNPTWTNCDVNPNGNYQGGIRIGEQVGRGTNIIISSVAYHDAGHAFEGDQTKACRGFVFKTSTGTLLNCMSFNNLKGADISNPLNGSPASVPAGWYGGFTNIGFVCYSNVLMGNGFNGDWGVAGGANKYTNDAIGWLINCVIVNNGGPGFKAYGGPSHVYVIGCTFKGNADNVLANPSGDLGDGGGPDTNVYVVTMYNNIFDKPNPVDGNVNNAYFGAWASNFTWTTDYNAYTATNPANSSEVFYQSSAYTGAGGEYIPASFLYGVNGPGHSSGSWYIYNGWFSDSHSIGTGSAVSTASPAFASGYGTINLSLTNSYGPGLNISGQTWYRPEMGVDINGNSRGSTPDMGAFQFSSGGGGGGFTGQIQFSWSGTVGGAGVLGHVYIFQPETLAYGTAITNNGGTISGPDFLAVDQWVVKEKANGTFANWLEFSPLAGNQTNASVVKLVTLPTFPTNLALTGFDSSYYTRAYGWSNYPGATFRYLTPGYNVQDINVAKPGICAYVTSYQVADSTGANALWGYWFASPFLYTFDAYALATDSYGLTEYFGNSSPQVPASQPCVLHGFIAVNQDLTASQTAWIGNDPVSQSSATFSTSGNSNPFRILATQDAADQFPGSIGAYGIWQNNNTNQIRLIYKNLVTLMQALGREPPPTNTLWVIPVTGQSLALATGSVTNVSRGFYNFNDYVCDDGPISTASPGTGNHVGIQRARENTKVESIATASLLEAQVLGISNQVSMIEDTDGVGGGTFATIGPGSIYYKGCLALATNGIQYSNYFPTVVCPAVFVIHGEADAASATYQANLETWAGSFATDMKNATGQSTAPKLFHSQASAIPNSANALSDLAMLAETELANRSNILVCPKYFLPYYIPNTPHLNEHGYQRLAEYYGKAFYKEFFGGGGWQPLRPVSITRSANVITATFTNATGGLVLDTNSIFPLYTNQVSIGMATNYGFSYTNDSSPPAITSVAVSGATSNQVTITLASTPSGANEILYYAIWNAAASGDQGGTTNILFGNLRNNDPTKGALSTSNLWDWCVHFKKSIPF